MSSERGTLEQSAESLAHERTAIGQQRAELERLQAELNAERERLRQQASKLDEKIMSIPEGRFTSRQEALLQALAAGGRTRDVREKLLWT